jgi:hypothetical protein
MDTLGQRSDGRFSDSFRRDRVVENAASEPHWKEAMSAKALQNIEKKIETNLQLSEALLN